MAVAVGGVGLGVVCEPVDHRGGDDVVAEDLAPAAEGFVAGHDEAGSFVAGGDELEEHVGRLGLERDVADLVDLCRARHSSTYAEPATMPMWCPGSGGWPQDGGVLDEGSSIPLG